MRIARIIILAAATAGLPANAVARQAALPDLAGERVRVTASWSGSPVVGVVESQSDGRLRIRESGGPLHEVTVDGGTTLQRSLGRHSNVGRGAGIGAMVGGAGGVGLGVWIASVICGSCDTSGSDYLVLGALYGSIGAVGGMLVGAVVGMATSNERWSDVAVGPGAAPSPRLLVAPDPDGGLHVGVSVPVR